MTTIGELKGKARYTTAEIKTLRPLRLSGKTNLY